MKIFITILLVAQVLFLQESSAQYIRTYGDVVPASCGTAIIQPPSVANSLADTLSLLTVSSLLAEALPLGPAIVTSMPCAAPAIAPAVTLGGCGCGCGYGGLGGCSVLM